MKTLDFIFKRYKKIVSFSSFALYPQTRVQTVNIFAFIVIHILY